MADILEPTRKPQAPTARPGNGPAPRRAPRTAVIVIAGVGDRPSGSASADLTAALLHNQPGSFRSAETVEEQYAPARSWCGEQPETTQTVTRHTLIGTGGEPVADVYEAWWADLSRFPGATRSAFLAAVGMLQQLTTVGRAALRGAPVRPCCDGEAPPATGPDHFGFGQAALGVVEWLVTVPIVCLAAILAALLGVADYAMAFNGATRPAERAGLAVVTLVTVAALVWLGRGYSRRRRGVLMVGVPLLVAALAIGWAMTANDGGRADRGIADTVFMVSVYPFRIAWMALAAAALLLVPVLAVQKLMRRNVTAGWRRIGTASLSMFGPFGLAVVGALVYAAIGAAVQKLAMQSDFGRTMPWCLHDLSSWQPVKCGADIHNAFDWGVALFATAIVPLMYVAGWVVLTLVGTALAVADASRVEDQRGSASALLRRYTTAAPWGVAAALVPTAAMVLLTYVPGGDHVLVWQQRSPGDLGGPAALLAAAAAWVIGGLMSAARLMKLNRDALQNKASISEKLRVPLDLAYDIATYLREPVREDEIVPRQKMLGRIASLLHHVATARHYDQCLIVSHSQGTVLATALLSRDRAPALSIPGDRLTLFTMGSPLRHVYAKRLPLQFAWVTELDTRPHAFVRNLDGPWINFGADDDLVGRTVFSDEGDGSMSGRFRPGEQVPHPVGPAGWTDVYTGPGWHGSYWTSPLVMREITAAIGVLVA